MPAKSKRTLSPKSAKPVAAIAAKPVAAAASAKPAKPDAAKPARVPANIVRTIATVSAQRTNFAEISDRDVSYLRFYRELAKANGGKLTVAQIAASGARNPHYNGSAKAHDAGAIVRLTKAALISGNGSEAAPITITQLGLARKIS